MSALYKPTVQWFRPFGLNHCTVGLDQKGKLPCTRKRSGQLEGSPSSFTRRIFQLPCTLCSASYKCKVTCPLEKGEGESIFFCFRKSGNRLNRSSCGPKRKGSLMAWWYLLLFCYPSNSEVVGSNPVGVVPILRRRNENCFRIRT